MNCCCAQGDFSNAQKVFDEMLERGIEPNVVIYTILIGVCFATRVKGMQGVALRVSSPKAMFYRVRIKGTQDTLLDSTGNHYFLKCRIIGKVDFICGRAKSLYEVI